MTLKLNTIACLLLASGAVHSAKLPQNEAAQPQSRPMITFESLVSSNAQLPAVQIYLAEKALIENKDNIASQKYIEAIELGVSDAVWNIMKLVHEGNLSDFELRRSLLKIKKMASEDQDLSLFLANYYHDRPTHSKEAFHWMNNSLRIGVVGVSETLADYILNGTGGAETHYKPSEAATLLRKSSDEGSGSAAIKLAMMFDDGILIPTNLGQARHYYDVAAQRGVIEANLRLAYFKVHGIGGSIDHVAAAELYKDLLNTEVAPEVHYRLSKLYMQPSSVFENARADGVSHLIKSSELGYPDALYKVGVSSYYGSEGFKVNIEYAIRSLTKAANSGNKLAAKRLVQLYKNGDRNIKPNKSLAREFQRILTDAPKL